MEMTSKLIQTWDPISATVPKKKSNIPIIHVIGLVGAGKSTFIQKYFPNVPVFDIKDIYLNNNFNPKDLHNNPNSYLQFQSALGYSFSQFYQNLKKISRIIFFEFRGYFLFNLSYIIILEELQLNHLEMM